MITKLKNLHFLPIDAPITESCSGPVWPRLPIEGELYISQDEDGNIYVSIGARGWARARPLLVNT